jgi:hypothetical protein
MLRNDTELLTLQINFAEIILLLIAAAGDVHKLHEWLGMLYMSVLILVPVTALAGTVKFAQPTRVRHEQVGSPSTEMSTCTAKGSPVVGCTKCSTRWPQISSQYMMALSRGQGGMLLPAWLWIADR